MLGLPWYGYRYECIDAATDQDDTCNIAQVPFRDVNCSDAAGTEVSYASINQILASGVNTTEVRRDAYLNTPYYNYRDADSGKVRSGRRRRSVGHP